MTKAHYAPLLEEVRDLVTELRGRDPESWSLRKWSAKLQKEARFDVPFRTIKRREEENETLDLGYVLACAIAADVEIVLGKNPRIVHEGVEGHAMDFVHMLRRAAAVEHTLRPSDVEELRGAIEGKLAGRVRRAG
jgi:hypothetical protein